jgi:hypothetical protein
VDSQAELSLFDAHGDGAVGGWQLAFGPGEIAELRPCQAWTGARLPSRCTLSKLAQCVAPAHVRYLRQVAHEHSPHFQSLPRPLATAWATHPRPAYGARSGLSIGRVTAVLSEARMVTMPYPAAVRVTTGLTFPFLSPGWWSQWHWPHSRRTPGAFAGSTLPARLLAACSASTPWNGGGIGAVMATAWLRSISLVRIVTTSTLRGPPNCPERFRASSQMLSTPGNRRLISTSVSADLSDAGAGVAPRTRVYFIAIGWIIETRAPRLV